MDVILRNEIVERVKAGDRIVITGTPIVVPDVSQLYNDPQLQRDNKQGRAQDGFGGGITGLKSLGVRELSYRIVFLASFARHEQDKTALNALHDMFYDGDPDQIAKQFTEADLAELEKMRQDRHLYHKLVSSIAPHIFGHEEIKKGLLLHLLGGVHTQTVEGMNLRGDINVCIVGDPSTAKSQFLKYPTLNINTQIRRRPHATCNIHIRKSIYRRWSYRKCRQGRRNW
jgi:DNA replication licensing factor MCM6